MQIQIEQKRAKEAKGEKGRMRPSNQSFPLLATIEIRIRSTRFPCSLSLYHLLFKKYERIEQELAEAAEKSKLQNAIETKGDHGHEARISSSVPL